MVRMISDFAIMRLQLVMIESFNRLYGDPVYVSSNCPTIWVDTDNGNVSRTDPTGGVVKYRQGLYMHKSAIILATQIRPRVQSQYKVEFLSDAIVADVAFGAKVVRTENTAARKPASGC